MKEKKPAARPTLIETNRIVLHHATKMTPRNQKAALPPVSLAKRLCQQNQTKKLPQKKHDPNSLCIHVMKKVKVIAFKGASETLYFCVFGRKI